MIDRAYEILQRRQLVADIMSRDVVKIVPHASIAEAARVMGANRIGSLIVLAAGAPHGIFTERDLLSRVLAAGKDPETVRVMEVMSTPLHSIEPTATIKKAAQTMIAQKGRLAVFDEGALVGIVTASDLVKSLLFDPFRPVPVVHVVYVHAVGNLVLHVQSRHEQSFCCRKLLAGRRGCVCLSVPHFGLPLSALYPRHTSAQSKRDLMERSEGSVGTSGIIRSVRGCT